VTFRIEKDNDNKTTYIVIRLACDEERNKPIFCLITRTNKSLCNVNEIKNYLNIRKD